LNRHDDCSHRRRGARQSGALSTSTSTTGDAVGHHSEYNQRVLTLGADVRELIMQTLHIIRTLVNKYVCLCNQFSCLNVSFFLEMEGGIS
jgi:hypothetical protein